MYKFKKSLIGLIGLIALAAIATTITPHLSYGSSGPAAAAPTAQTQNVNVVNTPTVNAQQSGTWVVRDVDNPARQRIEATINVNLFDGQSVGLSTLTTVPAGKTLVVEYISIDGRLTNQRLVSTRVGAFMQDQDLGRSHFLTLTNEGVDQFGRQVFIASQSMRLYFLQGTDVVVTSERNSVDGFGFVTVTLSGYLVNN